MPDLHPILKQWAEKWPGYAHLLKPAWTPSDALWRLNCDYPTEDATAELGALIDASLVHRWVKVEDCGELADGKYYCRAAFVECILTRKDGRWLTYFEVQAILSPHLGPIPEGP
jgi:hypothetical protein